MILNISNITGESLQGQIVSQIKTQILNGMLPSGYCLPSLRVLSREQRVSYITVQKAYETLENEGLIISQPGRGYFVRDIKKIELIKIAKKKLTENLVSLINTGNNDGLNKDDILDVLNNTIGKFAKNK